MKQIFRILSRTTTVACVDSPYRAPRASERSTHSRHVHFTMCLIAACAPKSPLDTVGSTTGVQDTSLPTTGVAEGPPSSCGPPCEHTWVHQGNLELGGFQYDSSNNFACLTHIVGDLTISNLDESQLMGLRNLISIDGSLRIGFSDTLTTVAPFECLQEVTDSLVVSNAVNLTKISAFSSLTTMASFEMYHTGVTELPSLPAEFAGIQILKLIDNAKLTSLDALTTWRVGSNGIGITIQGNPNLQSVIGLQTMLNQANGEVSLTLENLPSLQSLGGLEPMSGVQFLRLRGLPSIENLSPLSQLRTAYYLQMSAVPLVKNLQGLSQLEKADTLILGDCWVADAGFGMDGLISLEGLSSLVEVGNLGIGWNANMTSLTGADKVSNVLNLWTAKGNPKLNDDAIQEFADQVGQGPCISDACSCSGSLPQF